jgi:hypothetical protein
MEDISGDNCLLLQEGDREIINPGRRTSMKNLRYLSPMLFITTDLQRNPPATFFTKGPGAPASGYHL